jgi:hypothetical protein
MGLVRDKLFRGVKGLGVSTVGIILRNDPTTTTRTSPSDFDEIGVRCDRGLELGVKWVKGLKNRC